MDESAVQTCGDNHYLYKDMYIRAKMNIIESAQLVNMCKTVYEIYFQVVIRGWC